MAGVAPRDERGVRRFFDVLPVEAADAAASERSGAPSSSSTCTALRQRGYDRATRRGAAGARLPGGASRPAPELAAAEPEARIRSRAMADLPGKNFVRKSSRQRDVDRLISTPPGPYPRRRGARKEMTHIRDEINRITQSRRMLATAVRRSSARPTSTSWISRPPAQVDAWSDTGPRPKDSTGAGSWRRRRSRTRCREGAQDRRARFCVHKGLPLGPVATTTIRAT